MSKTADKPLVSTGTFGALRTTLAVGSLPSVIWKHFDNVEASRYLKKDLDLCILIIAGESFDDECFGTYTISSPRIESGSLVVRLRLGRKILVWRYKLKLRDELANILEECFSILLDRVERDELAYDISALSNELSGCVNRLRRPSAFSRITAIIPT